jgi:hypothetical protein
VREKKTNVVIPSDVFVKILNDYRGAGMSWGSMDATIDAIEVLAMRDNYLPVEVVLRILGRESAAEIIERKKEERLNRED